VAEHATGAAAIATIALAGTSALGSLHAPAPPAAPTPGQSQAALVTTARQPRPTSPPVRAKHPHRGCNTQDAEYAHCDSALLRSDAPPARDACGAGASASAGGEYG